MNSRMTIPILAAAGLIWLAGCSGVSVTSVTTKLDTTASSPAAPESAGNPGAPTPALALPDTSQSVAGQAMEYTVAESDAGVGASREHKMHENYVYPGSGQFVRRIQTKTPPLPEGDVTLNFEATDIREVIKVILGDILQTNYILDPRVQGTATLQTGKPVNRETLLPTLETLLRMNGAALVQGKGGYQVVPVAAALQGTAVPQLGDSAQPLPRGYGLRVVPLHNIGATEMGQILKPMAPDGSIIRIDNHRNLLVLAGTSPELATLLDTVSVFDVDWMKGYSVGMFTLEYSNAEEVVKAVEGVIAASKDDNPLTGLVRLIPVPSVNALLVITTQPRILEEARKWIERLDRAGGGKGERLFVYRVHNGDAASLADMLNQLYAEKGEGSTTPPARVAPGLQKTTLGGGSQSNSLGSGLGGQSRQDPLKAAGNQAQPAATSATLKLGNIVKVVADTINNSLLVRATPDDYHKLREALDQLDIMPLQVLVEATIIEVSLVGDLQMGLQWYFKTYHSGGWQGKYTLDGTQDDSKAASLGKVFPGFNWTLTTPAGDIRAVLNLFASDGLVNVLSSPSVMVLDNHTAKIQVGDQVPIATTQQQNLQGSNLNNNYMVNNIQYKDTGVMLSVQPRVSQGGLVTMEIEQEISDVSTTTTSSLDSPTIATRKIQSTVAVKNDQAIVLGGLIRERRSDTKGGLPVLYKLPLVGWLFGQDSKNKNRVELVVMITPKVIAGEKDIQAITDSFRAKLQGVKMPVPALKL
ncbi:MAG: type II secretion system secretin GspD [Pseudomonadota bacterium]